MITNLKQLMRDFDTEEKCRAFLVRQRWNSCPICPYCGSEKWYSIENGKRFKCGNKECYKKYSVTVGTVFHASNIPLTTWFPAMYILSAHKKGISSVQLAKDLGVTQKTAWFMMHRIRESLKDKDSNLLKGTIEADETYMARKYKSDFKGLPPEEVEYKLNSKSDSKGAVLGMVERNTGKVRVLAFANNNRDNITAAVRANVEKGSKLHTDESYLYRALENDYYRETVVHGRKEWVRQSIVSGKVHTNNVENFWGVMKRGIHGIYHQISFKHLQAYCNEFAYRYNSRDIKDGERFTFALSHIEGGLTYKQLVHGKGNQDSQENS